MNLPQAVTDYCRANGYGAIHRITPLGGGCINNASRLDTDNGPLFLKVNRSTPPDMFEREAEGLNALAAPKAIRVPAALCFGPDFILQEFIEPGPREGDREGDRKGRPYWETLGLQLAAMHNTTSPRFGFDHNNYIGSTPQINTWEDDGYKFFGEHRLLYQGELAQKNHLIPNLQSLISLIKKLPDLIPPQPASLLHGDL